MKVKKLKVVSWKNKPLSQEMKRFKKDVNSKGNPIAKF